MTDGPFSMALRSPFKSLTALAAVSVVAIQGCATSSSGADSSGAPGKTVLQSIACIGGGVGGNLLAKSLARSEAARQKLSTAQTAKRQRGYQIAFALMGCGTAAALAGTAYEKLSESGKRAREAELIAAAETSRPRTYRDPDNSAINGTVRPLQVYADTDRGRECRDVEDTLADAGKGEPIVVKMCRGVPNGRWGPVTA